MSDADLGALSLAENYDHLARLARAVCANDGPALEAVLERAKEVPCIWCDLGSVPEASGEMAGIHIVGGDGEGDPMWFLGCRVSSREVS